MANTAASRPAANAGTLAATGYTKSPNRPRVVHGLSLTDPRCADVLSALPGVADPATPAAIPAHNLTAVLGAFNASNLAASYIERGNFTAARRKLVQALAAVNELQGADVHAAGRV